VGLRVSLDVCGKSRLTGIRSPDRAALSEWLYRLRYPDSLTFPVRAASNFRNHPIHATNNEDKHVSITQNTKRSMAKYPCLYISTNFNSSHCNKTTEESTFLNLQSNINIQTPATSKRASEIVSATNSIHVA